MNEDRARPRSRVSQLTGSFRRVWVLAYLITAIIGSTVIVLYRWESGFIPLADPLVLSVLCIVIATIISAVVRPPEVGNDV